MHLNITIIYTPFPPARTHAQTHTLSLSPSLMRFGTLETAQRAHFDMNNFPD